MLLHVSGAALAGPATERAAHERPGFEAVKEKHLKKLERLTECVEASGSPREMRDCHHDLRQQQFARLSRSKNRP